MHPHTVCVIIPVFSVNINAVVSVFIITVNNSLIEFVAPFWAVGVFTAGPGSEEQHQAWAASPKRCSGLWRSQKIEADKLILVAFVI